MQTYSLQESKLLDPSHNHPSPPTVFAISSNFNLLLSASVSPPTIHLTNLLLNNPPILLRPRCSLSAVVTAEFHPERPNVFLLAFADGTCATYDAARIFRDRERAGRRSGPTTSGTTAETMFIKNLHATSNVVSSSALESAIELSGYDPSTGVVGIGNKAVGITAAAFVPRYKSRFVTVGADGKCCVIDLPIQGKRDAHVSSSWHVQGPATSLSVTSFHHEAGVFGQDREQARTRAEVGPKPKALIAIGCQDGRVLLFDLRGNRLGDECFHPNGSVVDVEWMSGNDVKMKRSKSRHEILQTPRSSTYNGMGTRGHSGSEKVISVMDGVDESLRNPIHDSVVKKRNTGDGHNLPATTLSHMKPFSPIKPLDEPKPTEIELVNSPARDSESSQSTVKAFSKKPKAQIAEYPVDSSAKQIHGKARHETTKDRPPMPSRSAPRKGGYPAEASNSQIADADANIKGHTPDRTMTARVRSAGSLALIAPYMKPNVISIPASSSNLRLKGSSNKHTAKRITPDTPDDVWTDIAPDPPHPSRKRPRMTPVERIRSYIKPGPFLPSPSGPSEASNDTVIDWSAASSRPPHPLIFHNLPEVPEKPSMETEKNRVSVSTSDDPLVQWSSFRKTPIFNIHTDFFAPAHHSPSLHSPLEQSSIPPTSALAETSHNPRPTPEAPGPATNCSPHSSTTAPCAFCTTQGSRLPSHLQTALQSDLRALGEDMTRQFVAQKRWFETKMDESRDVTRRLEAENRMLRDELARERRLGAR